MTSNIIALLSFKSFGQRMMRIMIIIISSIIICVLVLTTLMLVLSNGKPKPFLDENGKVLEGSISEKIYVDINGTKQGMFIKGKDKTKPVLLFLHGGPGMPEYTIVRKYPIVLEDYFTVCWWEQRGAGLSYSSDISPESLTFEQLISDTHEVTNYLRKRFGQDKIYLMAHSAGTFIGIQAATGAPELYKAYISMSQITNQFESEKLAYKYMVDEYTRLGDKKMLQKLQKYSVDEINTPSYYTMRDAPMHKLGIGTTHNMKSIISGVVFPIILNDEYTFIEKINVLRGKFLTTKKANLWSKLVETDITKKVTELDLPVYFFNGIYDYTCSYALAKTYFEQLKAPVKGFYSFGNSAHSPLFEEPDKMRSIIEKDILTGVNNNADIK